MEWNDFAYVLAALIITIIMYVFYNMYRQYNAPMKNSKKVVVTKNNKQSVSENNTDVHSMTGNVKPQVSTYS